jgi:hypothetical protein
MYFLFAVILGNGENMQLAIVMLALHQVAHFENEAQIHLVVVLDDLATAQTETRRLVKRLRAAVDERKPIDLNCSADGLHFVWLKYDPTAADVNEDGAGFYLEQTQGGVSVDLQPGEEFAIVLASAYEEDASDIYHKPSEAFARVYKISDDSADEPVLAKTGTYEA